MLEFFSIFCISLIISYLMTPVIRKLALFIGAYDIPDKRRIHNGNIPNIGGVAIYCGFAAGIFLFASFDKMITGIFIGGTFILILGLLDDLYELKPFLKLMGQIAAASILIFYGINIQFITNPFGELLYLGYWGIPLTIFWVVAITNTINLIDGLDGLATGVSIIAVITLFFVALQEGRILPAVMAVALAGSALGFLKYNFYPAKIFMGDTGAMFCGYILAAISIVGALKSAAVVTVFVPLLALGIPIFDTIFAIIRRIYNRKPISKADKGHIHHRLLALGWTQMQAVLIVYGISIVLGLVAITINGLNIQNPFLLLGIILGLVVTGAWKMGLFSIKLSSDNSRNSLENTNI